MVKPIRQFNANEGDYSIGLAGPDAIEADIDSLSRMFDPLTTHTDGRQGGISSENIQDNSVSDANIGDRTIVDTITDAYANTGRISKLLSFIAKTIKALKGTASWSTATSDTMEGMHTRINTNTSNITTANSNLTTHKSSADHDGRYYTKTQLNANQLGNIYYTKNELLPYLRGGETNIREEVFQIVNPNNGDGTFVYFDGTSNITGVVTPEGYQVFTFTTGYYELGLNRVECYINDTLRRSTKSGGLVEISENEIALSAPEGTGAEISFRFYERIGMTAEYNIKMGETQPPANDGKTMWFKVIG